LYCDYFTKRSIIGGDLNLPQAEWKGDAEKESGFQAIVNKLVWDNGYTQNKRRHAVGYVSSQT
jgi:hypothetical protein